MLTDSANSRNFLGSETYALDEKGRVTVPFDWRSRDKESDVFYLVPDTKGQCLRAMREERYAKFSEEARNLPEMTPEKHRMFMRNFFSQCAKATTDKQGRITIPKAYCESFNLKGDVRLIGAGDLFEIWNLKAQHSQQKQETPDYTKCAGALGL